MTGPRPQGGPHGHGHPIGYSEVAMDPRAGGRTAALTPVPAPAPPGKATAAALRVAVLDTNVVLDWLWFDDPRLAMLAAEVRAGALGWLGTLAMRAELAAVLGRASLPVRPRSADEVLADYDRWCRPYPPPADAQATPALCCSDADDQKFIDLALTLAGPGRAAALLTRDRAVLRLARPARARGLWIGLPEHWCAPAGHRAD